MAEHNQLGKAGEEAAARYLMFQGYSIRSRNWKCGHLEVDIVAERRGVLVFVEVKTRRNEQWGSPKEAVDIKKEQHMISAANAYMQYFDLEMQVRYDIISVIGTEAPFRIEHIENAFHSTPHVYVGVSQPFPTRK